MSSKSRNPLQSENFRRWFGDSKVVDDEGVPLVLYHGTRKDFSAFSVDMFNAIEPRGDYIGQGFFFTADTEMAGRYSQARGVEGANIIPVYLRIENPLFIDGDASREALHDSFGGLVEFYSIMGSDPSKIKDELQRRGYDGLIDQDYNQYATFMSGQIKSALGNSGAFDLNCPDICDSLSEPEMSAVLWGDAEGDGFSP